MADPNTHAASDNTPKSPPASGRSAGDGAASAPPEKDPMRDLLQRIERATPLLANVDSELARSVKALARQSADAERAVQPGFRTEVAYLLQDIEKSAVGRIELSATLRSEMTNLARSAPGLENERMLGLMGQTAGISDRSLVREIRVAGNDIGQQANQATPETQSRIDVIENRLRLTQRAPEPRQGPPTGPEQPVEPRQGQTPERPTTPEPPSRPRPDAVSAFTAMPGNGGQATQPVLMARSPLDAVFSAMRPSEKVTGAPWDPSPTPMRDRLSTFERTMQEGADDRTLRRAEQSGRAALDALQAFSTGEGAAVMSRIREAARSEPGGMASVLSEMKQGGRFADLRGQFNNALLDERDVAAAYDRAASALARHGEDRTAVEQVIARRPDAANLSAKFDQMDAAIGEAAGNTPSRKDGKAMLDDLAKAAGELLHRAVVAVKSMVSRSPSAEPTARPSSPSP